MLGKDPKHSSAPFPLMNTSEQVVDQRYWSLTYFIAFENLDYFFNDLTSIFKNLQHRRYFPTTWKSEKSVITSYFFCFREQMAVKP